MGKPIGKNKKHTDAKAGSKQVRAGEHPHPSPRNVDADTAMFVDMSRELKEEGNKLFQRRDYRGAVLKYEKAVSLVPRGHADVAPLRSSLAACFMQMEPADYHRAIEQCNLALEVAPKYSKALLKRAKCYEALDRLDFAVRDVDVVLSSEPNNATALEIFERVRKGIEGKGIKVDDVFAVPAPEAIVVKARDKSRKKKNYRTKDKAVVKEEGADDIKMETDKAVAKEESKDVLTLQASKVKLVLGEDIRVAQLPPNCTILQLREIVRNRFPSTKAVLVKYKDEEGDLVTITTTEELRWAEESGIPQGSLRLYITEVNPEQDPLFLPLSEQTEKGSGVQVLGSNQSGVYEKGLIKSEMEEVTSCIEEWIVQFAQLFKNHVGFNADDYLDLHGLGMKLYSEAIEDVVTSEDAQVIFDMAAEKFRELAALALFNWGNVHMSRARKRFFSEDTSAEAVLEEVKAAYSWAQEEYIKAGKQYEQALKIKPDFYEGFIALALQKFEQAKLSWYYAVTSKTSLDNWTSSEVVELFNNAEDSMEKGIQMWEEMEEHRLKGLSKPNNENLLLQKMGLTGLFSEISTDEAAEQALNIRSQINLLWGTMLYERSVVEFKLSLPTWEECLMASVQKFKLAGASATDLAVMMKSHCSNETAQEGLGFKIDEIVQAWNEMYDARRWACGAPSFRLEPLFRRRVPKLHHVLKDISV